MILLFLLLNSMKFNIYVFSLIMGTLLACSSSSWFTCWMGLEINLMSLIPIIISQLNPLSSETAIKYFIAQAIASVLIIFSSAMFFSLNSLNSMFLPNLLTTLALSIKMGAAPFHFWLPQVIQTTKWMQMIIILTWQKVAPMTLIMMTKNNFIKIILFMSCVVGALGAINQIIIKKILVYSSILHTGWLLSSILCSKNIWLIYFLTYSLISMTMIFSLTFSNINFIKQIHFSNIPPSISFFIFLNFLSLAGIPPFLGFSMKLIIIHSMFSLNLDPTLILVLIFSSLISLFYYLRLMFNSITLTPKMIKVLNNFSFKSSFNYFLLVSSSLGLFMFPLIFSLI